MLCALHQRWQRACLRVLEAHLSSNTKRTFSTTNYVLASGQGSRGGGPSLNMEQFPCDVIRYAVTILGDEKLTGAQKLLNYRAYW
jgi:hypothetical protein